MRLVMAADTALVRSDHAHRRLVGKDAREGCEVPGRARTGPREADNLHIPPRPGPLRSRSTHAFPVTGACFLAWYPVSLALLCPPADKISFSFFLPSSFSFFLSLSLFLSFCMSILKIRGFSLIYNIVLVSTVQKIWASLVAQRVKKEKPTCNAGDLGLIPGSERSPGEGNDNPLQYSCLETSMDRGAWQATVHEIAKE